jgi:DNA-directed RNA polymerase subunit RPC12/RpoP
LGTSFTYRCSKCEYEVQTSGGLDWGFLAVTDTYICKSCKNIVDVAVGLHGKVYPKGQVLQKKAERKIDLDLDFYVCPECGSDNHLVKWDKRKKPCPKCAGKMQKDLRGGIVLWD